MKTFAIKVSIVVLSFTLFGAASAAKSIQSDLPTTKIFRVNR